MAKRPANREVTSKRAASAASKVLRNPKSSKAAKTAAGSALTQRPNKSSPKNKWAEEFRRDAVRIATTGGLTRPKAASDLGVGLSTLNKWVQKHHHDLMSGPHEDVGKENARLRKEVRLLREEREVLKKAQVILHG